MLTIKNFDRIFGFRIDGYKEIIPQKKVKPEQYASKFDVIVAHTDLTQGAIIGNAECVLTASNYNKIIFSMDLVKVTPKANGISKFLILSLLQNKKFKDHCLKHINGTTVMHLSKKALPDYSLYLPADYSVFKVLNEELERLYILISNNLEEIIKLQELKSYLLSVLSR